MDTDRRGEGNQVPARLKEVLNKTQLSTLSKMEGFGWILAFIRRPLFQKTVPVLLHPDGNKLGTLEEDGALNVCPGIEFRS